MLNDIKTKEAARILDLNYSSAKTIIRIFRQENRVKKKNSEEEDILIKILFEKNQPKKDQKISLNKFPNFIKKCPIKSKKCNIDTDQEKSIQITMSHQKEFLEINSLFNIFFNISSEYERCLLQYKISPHNDSCDNKKIFSILDFQKSFQDDVVYLNDNNLDFLSYTNVIQNTFKKLASLSENNFESTKNIYLNENMKNIFRNIENIDKNIQHN